MDVVKNLKEKLGDSRKAKQNFLDERAQKIDELELLMNKSKPDQKAIESIQDDVNTLKYRIQNENRKIEELTDKVIAMGEDPNWHKTNDEFSTGYGVSGSSSGTYWADKNGNSIRVYNSGEKMAQQTPDYSLGEFAAAMLTGARSSRVKNALVEGSDASGGFTVPSLTMDSFFDNMRAKSRVASLSRSIQLNSDETVIARVASDPVASWKSEGATSTPGGFTFEGVVFRPKVLRFIVLASRELISDSINIREALESVFAGTTAAELDRAALFGSGVGPVPEGLTNKGINEVAPTAADGDQLTSYDKLVKAYRLMLDDNAAAPTGYIMSPREFETLAVLKDSTGQPLRRPQVLDNIPLLETTNVPVDETQGVNSNASRIVCGNWQEEFVIGLRQQMRIELLREKYADTYQFGFLVHLRVDFQAAHLGSFSQITGIIP